MAAIGDYVINSFYDATILPLTTGTPNVNDYCSSAITAV